MMPEERLRNQGIFNYSLQEADKAYRKKRRAKKITLSRCFKNSDVVLS